MAAAVMAVAPAAAPLGLFARRFAALAIDAGLVAAAVMAIVHLANALAGGFGFALFHPYWAPPPVVHVAAEPAGDSRVETARRTIAHHVVRQETRVFADGSVEIVGIIDTTEPQADGTLAHYSVASLVGRSRDLWWRRQATLFLMFVLPFLYGAFSEGSRWQATLGKRVMGLQVVDEAGRRLGPGRALWRQVMKLGEVCMTGLGYFLAAVSERRQAFHDILSRTRVVPAGTP